MVLSATTLSNELRKFLDPDYGSFTGFPTSEANAAAKWATAMDVYTGAGLGITPSSVNGAAAKALLEAGLNGMAAPGAGPAAFETGFAAYALSIAGGMSATHTATPPAAGTLSPAIAAQGAANLPPNPPQPPSVQVPLLAGVIHTWFITGTATPNGGGPTINWS